MLPQVLQTLPAGLDQAARFVSRVQSIQTMKGQLLSRGLQSWKIPRYQLLFKRQIAGAEVHDRRDIRGEQQIKGITCRAGGFFHLLLGHRRHRHLHALSQPQQDTEISYGFGGIQTGDLTQPLAGDPLKSCRFPGEQGLEE